MLTLRSPLSLLLATCVALTLAGCGGGDGSSGGNSKFISVGTAPVGGTFPIVGGDIAEVLNNNAGENGWKVQAKGTKGSQENIRRLAAGDLQLALSNAAISYFAVRGEGEWNQQYDIRTVATMAPNVAMFITLESSGIKTIEDLKGKRVIVGPSGAGFEMFVAPILEEHGLTFDDFTKLNDTQSGAVDKLGDGNADAAFLGGAVPNSAISQACSSYDVHFIPFEEDARQRLIEKYPFFESVTIKADTYPDLGTEFPALNVGSMHLITHADQDEEFVYQITKTLWEHRGEINHPAGKFVNEENAARDTGTPLHPGAEKFYQEIGILGGGSGDTEEPAEHENATDAESE